MLLKISFGTGSETHTTIRIATFNLHGFGDSKFSTKLAAIRHQLIAEFVRDHDLVFFQEIYPEHRASWNEVLKLLPNDWVRVYSEPKGGEQFVALYRTWIRHEGSSNITIDDSKQLFKKAPPWATDWRANDWPFTVVTVHLASGDRPAAAGSALSTNSSNVSDDSTTAADQRDHKTEAQLTLLRHHYNNRDKVNNTIILGDFNVGKKAKLKDFLHFPASDGGAAVMEPIPLNYTTTMWNAKGAPNDQILVSSDIRWRVDQAIVHQDRELEPGMDHMPVTAEFNIIHSDYNKATITSRHLASRRNASRKAAKKG